MHELPLNPVSEKTSATKQDPNRVLTSVVAQRNHPVGHLSAIEPDLGNSMLDMVRVLDLTAVKRLAVSVFHLESFPGGRDSWVE